MSFRPMFTAVVLLTIAIAPVVAAAQSSSPGIWIMDRDGGNPKLLVKLPDYRWQGSPCWSQDGKWLSFDAAKIRSGPANIYRIATDGRDMTIKDLGPGRVPCYSPNGKKIAFNISAADPEDLKRGVWTMNADGSARKWHSEGVRPKWSPDGKSLAFTSGHEGKPSVYILRDGKRQRVLHEVYNRVIGASWSPDGKRLTFIGQRDGTSELAIISAAGEKDSFRLRVRGRIGWVPSWSPDGKLILFWKKQDDGAYRFHTVNPDAKDEPMLIEGQTGRFNSDPSWSPNGKRIAFTSDREE